MKIKITDTQIQQALAHQLNMILYNEFEPQTLKEAGVPGRTQLVRELLDNREWFSALKEEIRRRAQESVNEVFFDSVQALFNDEVWISKYQAPALLKQLVEQCDDVCANMTSASDDLEVARMAEILRRAGFTVTAPE